MNNIKDVTVAVVGLGYVGLPLAVAFGTKMQTIGFDIKVDSIAKYQSSIDPNEEVTTEQFLAAEYIQYSSDPKIIGKADFIVVAVPTPIDQARQPDLTPIVRAAETVGMNMKNGSVVIFESTVYPGVTEDICVPILEKHSGLTWKDSFHVGYSPERINPGDKEHTLSKIVKVVSADSSDVLSQIAKLYEIIIDAGVYRAGSIKEAEAAKVIENTQRDLNIALMNELAVIFDRLDIDTINVLEAAGTKWNFLPFRPGLVGGHCIGVDPYYLTHKAETVGYHPQVILAGRHINDNMGKFVAEKTIKLMLHAKLDINQLKVGVVGLTFKEDCPDLRNSRVIDIIRELETYGVTVMVHDPKVAPEDAESFFGVTLSEWADLADLGALIYAVPHKEIKKKTAADFVKTLVPNGCLIDVKSSFSKDDIEDSNITFWRL